MSDTESDFTNSPAEHAIMAGIYFVQAAEKADINPVAILGLIEAAKQAGAFDVSEPAPVGEAIADE